MIFYDFKSSLSPQDCTAYLWNGFGSEASHLGTVRRMYAEFVRGRVSLRDEIREGRPSAAITEENMATVRLKNTGVSSTGPVCTITLAEQTTVNAEWCTIICLSRILEKVREKRTRNLILLHHDNASPQSANKTMSFLTSEKVKLVTHPAFSPDLAPRDFFILTKIIDLMRGLIFTGPEKAVIAFDQRVQNMPSDQ
ncbi:Histone-lysine N-methyltransferase SETMAR [Eumeta japonica]|uniref:Histone-lysine N-methyltransferase SETMAR n=1 Tax=Eumeta variegata TaxID=151549 RepID=A0A4C1XVA7_EUMVA|nr:Histone-lysine N-methyltransferase SETMAR [Eumeta japonica]